MLRLRLALDGTHGRQTVLATFWHQKKAAIILYPSHTELRLYCDLRRL